MSKFIRLRAKSYYYDSWDPINRVEIKSKKKNKGIKSSVVETNIISEDYEKCIFDKKKKTIKQNLIQSYKHNLHSITQEKIALTDEDDKRIILDDNMNTISYGHYKILSRNPTIH
jgi:hypothetical protein